MPRFDRDVTPALRAAREAGVAFRVHELAARAGDAAETFAADLGVDAARVFKTLVVSVEGSRLAVAVVPIGAQLDMKALASAAGGALAEMADGSRAERATGYRVGAISPLGQRRRLPTFLDASALGFETIFVSAGRRGLELELAPRELARLCDAQVVPLARG